MDSREKTPRDRMLESEAKYRALFENMSDEVHVWDLIRDEEGRIHTWVLREANPAALGTWGRTLDQIRGKTADEIFGPGTSARYRPVVEKIFREGIPYSTEEYVPSLDKHFRFRTFPLGDGFITTGAEISELRQAERELHLANQRIEALMKAVPVGVSFSEDATCRQVTGNPAVLAQFEVTGSDNLSASAPDPDAPGRQVKFYSDGRLLTDAELPLQRAVAEVREIPPIEMEVHLPSGRQWFAEASGAPILDPRGQVIGGVAVCVDITERKHRDDQMRDLLQRLTYHVDHSPLAVLEWNADLRLVRWSGAAERVFGWKADEVAGKRLDDLHWLRIDEQSPLAGIGSEVDVHRSCRKDGSVAYCEWHNSSLTDSAGNLQSILSLVLDVTERTNAERDLRESRDLLSLAQRIAQAGTFDLDLRTNAMLWSEELQALYGIGPGQPVIEAEEWIEWVVPEDRSRVSAEIADGIRSGSVVSQFRIHRRDNGEIRWIERRGRCIRDANGDPVRMVGFSIDISDQKRSEVELQGVLERYRQSNEQLQQFTYIASHDLQEPLRNIANFSALLERRLDSSLDPQTSELLRVIRVGAQRMRALVDDLLAYSRVELETQEMGTVDMQKALSTALENLRRSIDSAGAEICVDSLPAVLGHENRLVQLFQNLVGNAVKYRGEEKPRIHISASTDGDRCTFAVRDNGIGISRQYHERIFGIFKRLHAERDYPGTGIGLAICRKIVETHGGRIWVESEIGKGSTFLFVLRAAGSEAGFSTTASFDTLHS